MQLQPTDHADPRSMERLRICLLGASFGTGNLGVSALAAGTVTAVLSSFPDAEIFLLDYGKEPSVSAIQTANGEVKVETVNIRFSKKAYLENNIARLLVLASLARMIPLRSLERRLVRSNSFLKRIADADLVLSIAGGDSFSDIYGFGRFLYIALPQILALILKKRLVLMPQTLGPFKGRCARTIARWIIQGASAVYSRDKYGVKVAERELRLPSGRIQFSFDMAFAMEPVAPQKTESRLDVTGDATVVGMNVSGLLMAGGYTRDNMFGLRCDYPELVRHLITEFLRVDGVKVRLIPHVLGDDPESDSVASLQLFEELSPIYGAKIEIVRDKVGPQEMKFLIGQCDFFVGARMHANIGALSQAVPAVSLAYSRKFIGVMESLELPELVVDLKEKEMDVVVREVMQIFAERERLRAALRRTMPDLKAAVLRLAKGFNENELGAVPVASAYA